MDLRSERTVQWIEETFIKLVIQEGFSKVTVSQISNEAMINRKTFYAHFLDKYDLAQQLATRVLTKYKTLIGQRFGDKNIKISDLVDSFLDKEDFELLQALFLIHTEEFDFEKEFSTVLTNEIQNYLDAFDTLEIQIFVNLAITTAKYYLNHPEEKFSVERQQNIILKLQRVV